MRTAVFSTKRYDREFLSAANAGVHELHFFEPQLDQSTALLAAGLEAVCVFVNDRLDASVLAQVASSGARLVGLRCAGFNNVDLAAAKRLGIGVARVPAYSRYAVAEHTLGLILALNRHLHRAYGLKSGKLGYLGLDVYEEEGDIFFEDRSSRIIRDDVFTRLLTFPNVLITGHQAFFTRNALEKIAATTIANITEFDATGRCENQLVAK